MRHCPLNAKILFLFTLGLVFSDTSYAQTIITSHKSAGLEYPENSLPGIEHSLGLAVQAIEFDIHVTKDREIVLSHDPVLDNENCFATDSARKILIAQSMAAELLALTCTNHKLQMTYRLPTLDEVLLAYKKSQRSDIELNIEIKVLDKLIENAPRYASLNSAEMHVDNEEVAHLLYAKLREHNIDSHILFSTFSRELLNILQRDRMDSEQFRFGLLFKGEYAPKRLKVLSTLIGQQCYDTCWWPNWKETRQWLISNNIDVFIPNWPQLNNVLFRSGFKRHFQREERPFEIYPWTLNDETEWQAATKLNFDGIITDRPSAYLQWVLAH